MQNRRYLKQNQRQRIEHEMVMNRMGELAGRDLETLIRTVLFNTTGGIAAFVFNGLQSTPGVGLSVDVAGPAAVITNAGSGFDDVLFVTDTETTRNVPLDPADPVNPRIDILIARRTRVDAFLDTATSQADGLTQVITPTTVFRDREYQLELSKVTGTPAGSPVPPAVPTASAGRVLGTVDISAPINLQSEYILSIAVGEDGEFTEVDCRGAVPSSTTLAEIVTEINTVFFPEVGANIAFASGNFLLLEAPGTGATSVIRLKQPTDANLDAAANILGVVEGIQYVYYFRGSNPWFKVNEVTVPATAVALVGGNIVSIEAKDSWVSDAATIRYGVLPLRQWQELLDADDGYPGRTLRDINLFDASTGLIKSLLSSLATAPRTWSFPDKSGTVAMLDDVSFTLPYGLIFATAQKALRP